MRVPHDPSCNGDTAAVSPYVLCRVAFRSSASRGDVSWIWTTKVGHPRTSRGSAMVVARVAPWFDPVRADPRFQELVRRMNFPQ